MSYAQFTLNANFLGKIEFFSEKSNKFIGALTKLNVVQKATLKEKKFQYGAPNNIHIISAAMCLQRHCRQ